MKSPSRPRQLKSSLRALCHEAVLYSSEFGEHRGCAARQRIALMPSTEGHQKLHDLLQSCFLQPREILCRHIHLHECKLHGLMKIVWKDWRRFMHAIQIMSMQARRSRPT